MKNWVTKFLLLLLLPSLAGVLLTAALGANPGGWLQIATYLFPSVLTLVGGFFVVGGKWRFPFLLSMLVSSLAFNIPLQNWLFHSANEVVRYRSVTDLYTANQNVLYFMFDTLHVDYAHRSSVTVKREITRSNGRHRYRKETKFYHYTVAPAFEDDLPRHKYADREVKAWVVPVKHEKHAPVICYERCMFELDDYQKAIDKSPCTRHHPQAMVIRPLYKPFISTAEWKTWFINIGSIVLSILILAGVIVNYKCK